MLSLLEVITLGFASARGTQLLVHDSILDGARARFEMWHARKFDSRVRTFFRDLLACVYCTGYWCSVATVVVYLVVTGEWSGAPLLVHGIETFAVAGVQMMINRYDDHLGS